LGARSSYLLDAVHAAVLAHSQPIASRDLQVVPAELGTNSETFGAAARVLRDEQRLREYLATI
jgi:hypothetical protein